MNPPTDDDQLLLTASQVAHLLGVSERSLRRIVAAGALARRRPRPGTVRFHRHDVEAFATNLPLVDALAPDLPPSGRRRELLDIERKHPYLAPGYRSSVIERP